jgi:hypothetical protein
MKHMAVAIPDGRIASYAVVGGAVALPRHHQPLSFSCLDLAAVGETDSNEQITTKTQRHKRILLKIRFSVLVSLWLSLPAVPISNQPAIS